MIPTPSSLRDSPELDALVIRLKNGDETAKDQIILGFVQVVQRIAFNWHRRTKRSLDMLEGEALYLLTLAVNKAQRKLTDNNIGPYINTYVNRNLVKYLYTNRYLPASPEKLKKLRILRCPLFAPIYEDESSILVDWKQMEEQEMNELLQTIEFCIQTNEERTVFTLRIAGYKNEEIAGVMGLSYHQVGRIRRELERRLRKELGLEKTRVHKPNRTQTVS